MPLQPNWVFCARAPEAFYARYPDVHYPELPEWAQVTTALVTLRSLFLQAGLDHQNFGTAVWNPLGTLINKGDKVAIKPNWVHHVNQSGQGLDCLVTHTDVIEAILHYVAKSCPESIVVCDAPVQGCDFEALMGDRCVHEMILRFATHGVKVEVKDLRRTILSKNKLGRRAEEGCRPMEDYILYDLGCASSLEEITTSKSDFRVTMYNPDLLRRTHAPGKHQYLIAKEIIDADVVINVPKLKTHKKACITGALKNVVGINGHKEYLPHHRKGGSQAGGDCYPGGSPIKGLIEEILDVMNRSQTIFARTILAGWVRAGTALGKVLGNDTNYEGSWHGNDTVWRMTLDLQRVLYYGLPNGMLSNLVQRKILTVTDAIIAGEGEGPLSPTPIHFGMMTLGVSTAAMEWVHAILMGLPPHRIPLIREAFKPHQYPLTNFTPEQIIVQMDGRAVATSELFLLHGRAFQLPIGWREYFEPDRLENVS